MSLTISDSIPIQFWLNGEETFNEKEVCGMTKQDCFCQIFNCDDEIKIQFRANENLGFELVSYDINETELARYEFEEISPGYYQTTFTNDTSPCDVRVKYVIEQVSTLGQSWTLVPNDGSYSTLNWSSIAYGEGTFVATAPYGVMSSVDGKNWHQRTGIDPGFFQSWTGVTYGNGIFVAVGYDSANAPQVMTSPDGIYWTGRSSANTNQWFAVTFGNGLFVSVAASGTGNRVMTSSDGITWTARSSAADNDWKVVAYGGGLFVAMSTSGTGNRLMTSPNGITWTIGTSPGDYTWSGIAYGNNMWLAVSTEGYTSTSTNGTTWTAPILVGVPLRGVSFGNGYFLILGDNLLLMTTDGVNRTTKTIPTGGEWKDAVFGDGIYVVVGFNAGLDKFLMYSDEQRQQVATSDCVDIKENHDCSVLLEYSNTSNFDDIDYETNSPNTSFQLRIPAIFFEEENPQEQEDLELSNGVIVTLRQSIVEKRKLETGFMPNYMHRKLQKVLMHDSVYIDGDYWKKRDAYDTSPVKKYNLKTASVFLTKYDSVEKNTI